MKNQVDNSKGIQKHDAFYIRMALFIAQESKCKRAKYGSIIVAADGKRVLATGYNGKPSGSINDLICYREGLKPNVTNIPNCCLHSEVNALLFSDPTARVEGTMYISGIPCQNCALIILQAGLKRIVYLNTEDMITKHRGDSNNEFFNAYGVSLERVCFTFEEHERLFPT